MHDSLMSIDDDHSGDCTLGIKNDRMSRIFSQRGLAQTTTDSDDALLISKWRQVIQTLLIQAAFLIILYDA